MATPVDKEKVILDILKGCAAEGATTTEILKQATKIIEICPDRLVSTLSELHSAGKINRQVSKTKKGIVWSISV